MLLIMIGILLTILLFDMIILEPSLYRIKKYTLNSDVKQAIRIVHFSDTHYHKHFSKRSMLKMIIRINRCKPDFIVFTGDLMDNYACAKELRYLLPPFLKALHANYAKLAVYGNHDIGGGAKHVYADMMKEGGFIVLRNERIVFEQLGIAFFGIDDVLAGYEDKTITQAKLAPTQILLLHEPDIVERLDMSQISVTMSGHTHGGQIRLPYLTKLFLPKGGRLYPRGIYPIDQTILSVTCGIGTTTLPFRFACPSELLVYELKPINDK